MSALAMHQTQTKPAPRLSGRLILGDVQGTRGTTTFDVDNVRIGRRGLTFPFTQPLAIGRFAWVEVEVARGKTVKPLVAVLAQTDGVVSVRIVHCFPEHQRIIDAHLASASGY